MASRKDIREAFYAELETAATGLVDAKNIRQEQSELDEAYPSIVHEDSYLKENINEGSGAPTRIERDANGDATAAVFTTMHTAVFQLLISDHDEQRKENIYETVRKHFEKYEHPDWDASDIHADVEWVRVFTSNSEDEVDHEPILRGDRFQIRLTFQREFKKTGTAISQFDTSVDADNDGTTDETYTFSG